MSKVKKKKLAKSVIAAIVVAVLSGIIFVTGLGLELGFLQA